MTFLNVQENVYYGEHCVNFFEYYINICLYGSKWLAWHSVKVPIKSKKFNNFRNGMILAYINYRFVD